MKKTALPAMIFMIICILFTACDPAPQRSSETTAAAVTAPAATAQTETPAAETEDSSAIAALGIDELYISLPEYASSPWVQVGGGTSDFGDDITTVSFEEYYDLDDLGRCTLAFACLGRDLMPTQKRGNISSVHPTGWQSVNYDFVDGKSLYNRCHLIGWQLSGEDANERNLVTGTRYMNTDGMLPFENMVADYIKETDGHVMYRVTPYFYKDELVCRGVFMEAYSVEDEGDAVDYYVFCYNVQPGVIIDYTDGSSSEIQTEADEATALYILNRNTKRFHLPECPDAASISEKNRAEYTGARSALIERGYTPCSKCEP